MVITEPTAARLFDFLRAKYVGRYGSPAEAMARWQVKQVFYAPPFTPLFTLLLSDLFIWRSPDFFARPMLKPLGYPGAFVVVALPYSPLSSYLGGLRYETVVSQVATPAQANDLLENKMKFVDEASILVVAGDGGNGCVTSAAKNISRKAAARTAVMAAAAATSG